jgi:hypothetical protein
MHNVSLTQCVNWLNNMSQSAVIVCPVLIGTFTYTIQFVYAPPSSTEIYFPYVYNTLYIYTSAMIIYRKVITHHIIILICFYI